MASFHKQGSSLHPDDIISNHSVHFQNECSLTCLREPTCQGFNYRITSNNYVVNCQLSSKARKRENDESEEAGGWTFYQDVSKLFDSAKTVEST